MVTIGLIGLLFGGVMGIRYRVYVLIPAHFLATLIAGLDAFFFHPSMVRLLLSLVVWSVGCNVGYVLGAIVGAFRRRAPVGAPLAVPPPPHLHR